MTIKAKPPYRMMTLSRRASNPYTLNERDRSHQDPHHSRNKHEDWQRRERGDQYARTEEDGDPGEESDLAHIEGRETDIGEALPHQGIAQQHDREQRKITIARE